MTWYRAGSVAVTNGSPVVIGTGTSFVGNVQIGHAQNLPDGRVYEVAAVNSDTQITLGSNYLGPTASGQDYSVQPNQGFAQQAASALATLLTQFTGYITTVLAGRFGDGTLGAPGVSFSAEQGTGLRRIGSSAMSIVTAGIDRLTVDGNGNASASGTFAANDPGSGTTGALKIIANPSTGLGTLQIVSPNQQAQYGYLQFGNGTMSYNGALGVDAGGNVKTTGSLIGTTPSNGTTSGGVRIKANASGTAYLQILSADETAQYGLLSFSNGVTNINSALLLDASGNLLVGITGRGTHTIAKAGGQGTAVLSVEASAAFYSASNFGYNGAATVLALGANSTTGRSLNAAGTINANGADYAEYMTKAATCALIAKGDICGVDADGHLVTTWADARWFRIKSTAPNLVGGDGWSAHVGARPSEPVLEPPAYDGPAEPVEPNAPTAPAPLGDMPKQPARDEGEDDDAYALRLARFLVTMSTWQVAAVTFAQASAEYTATTVAYGAASARYATDRAAFDMAQNAHAAAVAAATADHDAAMTTFASDLAAFETALEAARQTVDRIAYCGQVPVNFTGACSPGDYLIAVQDGNGIGMAAVAPGDITFEQYRMRVGAVLAIKEGRPLVDVQHG